MLLWEVLLDGTLDMTKEAMQRLRDSGSVSPFARARCKMHLESHHRDEQKMFSSLLHLLDDALQEDPLRRPSAAILIPHIRALAQDE